MFLVLLVHIIGKNVLFLIWFLCVYLSLLILSESVRVPMGPKKVLNSV